MARAWPVDDVDPDASLAMNARRILAVRMAEFFSYAPIVPFEDAVEALHDLRIAAKRLRYTLELFRVVFGERGERQIEHVKAIQEDLGLLHDHDVRIALIEDELSSVAIAEMAVVAREVAAAPSREHPAIVTGVLRPPPDDPRRGLIALLGREHAARRQRYQSFRALWDRLIGEGMRGELAALSATPIAAAGGRDDADTSVNGRERG